MLAIKDYLVTFDDAGDVESIKDITNSAVDPRPRFIAVRAKSVSKAAKAAEALYSLAK